MANAFTRLGPRNTKETAGSYSRYVQLKGLPRTALPADIRRLFVRTKMENIASVDLQYKAFLPTGDAWVGFTAPEFSNRCVNKVRAGVHLGAFPLDAAADPTNGMAFVPRTRGSQGRAEAAERGAPLLGDGPSARLKNPAHNVALVGFPNQTTTEEVRGLLKSFRLAEAQPGDEILKVVPDRFSAAKFVVRLESPSEAHRLARRLHQTAYETPWGKRSRVIKAHVIY